MIRQICAFRRVLSPKENAKHVAGHEWGVWKCGCNSWFVSGGWENARHGLLERLAAKPIGIASSRPRVIPPPQQHENILEIDPIQAETVRLIFRLARGGHCVSGPIGRQSITKHLNVAGHPHPCGGR